MNEGGQMTWALAPVLSPTCRKARRETFPGLTALAHLNPSLQLTGFSGLRKTFPVSKVEVIATWEKRESAYAALATWSNVQCQLPLGPVFSSSVQIFPEEEWQPPPPVLGVVPRPGSGTG